MDIILGICFGNKFVDSENNSFARVLLHSVYLFLKKQFNVLQLLHSYLSRSIHLWSELLQPMKVIIGRPIGYYRLTD